jgi:hypothetical protein
MMICHTRGDSSTTFFQKRQTAPKVTGAKGSSDAQKAQISMRSSAGKLPTGVRDCEEDELASAVIVTNSIVETEIDQKKRK